MKKYLDLLQTVLENGEEQNDRTGVGTLQLYGEMLKFDLRNGFPAITTKKLAQKAFIAELIWFLRGSTNLYDLRALQYGEKYRHDDSKRTIWDANYYKQAVDLGYKNGDMGDLYGAGWRDFGGGFYGNKETDAGYDYIIGIDQIRCVIEEAKKNPASRRLLVNAWNPRVIWEDKGCNNFIPSMAALPPCHFSFHLNIVDNYIDLSWHQRSADVFLGIPANIFSYGVLLSIFGRILEKTPRYLVGHLDNVHLYKNHIDAAKIQLERTPYSRPSLWINPNLKTLDDFEGSKVGDYKLENYQFHESIKAPRAV